MLLLGKLPLELAPLLFGPPKLLRGRCEIEEMDGNDRGSGTEVGISDQCIELTARLSEAGFDVVQSFLLRLCVGVSTGSSQAYSS